MCHCGGGGTGLVGHCTEGSELIDSVLDVVLRRVDFAEVFAVHVAVESLWRWVAALDLHLSHVECCKDRYNNHIDSNRNLNHNHNQEIACGSLWSSDPPRPEECSSQGSLVKPKATLGLCCNGSHLLSTPFSLTVTTRPDAGCFSACRGWIAPGTRAAARKRRLRWQEAALGWVAEEQAGDLTCILADKDLQLEGIIVYSVEESSGHRVLMILMGLNSGNMDDAPVDQVGQLLWPHSVVFELVGRRGRRVHRNWGAARGLRHGRSSRATVDEFKKTEADTSGKTVKDHMSLRVDTSLPTSSFNMDEPTLLGRM